MESALVTPVQARRMAKVICRDLKDYEGYLPIDMTENFEKLVETRLMALTQEDLVEMILEKLGGGAWNQR